MDRAGRSHGLNYHSHAYLTAKFEAVAVLLLLPVFFAFTGLRTSIGLVQGPQMWWMMALVTTFMTSPLSEWIYPARERQIEAAEREETAQAL